MSREAAEAGPAIAAQAIALKGPIGALANRIAAFDPVNIMTCARGSSDHAALFGKYAFEMTTGLPVASLGPSVVSIYDTKLNLARTLYITISQSGQSPDLIRCAEAARASGALVVAIVNDPVSPLARAAQVCLDIGAGPETAVAATKSFLCSVSVLLRLIVAMKRDEGLALALDALPGQLLEVAKYDWSLAIPAFTDATNCFVIARGPALGIASEMALKLKEVAAIHAVGISAAEVHHGPKAAAGPGMPVIVLGSDDAARASIEAATDELSRIGARIFTSLVEGKAGTALPSFDTGHALTRSLVQLASFYSFADRLARARGRDGAAPATLSKITRTT